MQVLSNNCIRAYKSHFCDHCQATIPAGQYYSRAFIIDGGDSWTWKSHLDCHALACRLHDLQGRGWDEGITLSEEWSNEREDVRAFRGEFPHVICRLEYREQMSVLRARERLREDNQRRAEGGRE